MNEHDEIQVSEWLRDGIAAAKAGRKAQARALLMRVVEANEESEQAWLWLSGVVDTDEDRLICLENVLTLNPDNVQARAGMRHLQARGFVSSVDARGLEGSEHPIPPSVEPQLAARAVAVSPPDAEFALTLDGCVYCGRVVNEQAVRCPYCGGQLSTKQFKDEERSGMGYLLHAYWVLLIGIDVADFFLIGFVWDNIDQISPFIQKYLPYVVGRVVTGEITLDAFLETELLVQLVRYSLLALAVLGALDALGLFLRRPLAHTCGILLAALHLVLGLSFFILGFLGYLLAAFRALYTVMLTVFMFNTVEDFTKVERRERLEPDRHLRNDADFYTRGRVYEKRGMWAKALLHWRRAVALKPNRDTYYAAVARGYAHLGQYGLALDQLNEAVRVSRRPEEWEPLRRVILEAQARAVVTPDARL